MTRIGSIALIAASLYVASGPAFAFSERALSAGEKDARRLMRLMDQSGQVSKAEFMQFMEAEFDRIDTDRGRYLTLNEWSQSNIHYRGKTTVPHR